MSLQSTLSSTLEVMGNRQLVSSHACDSFLLRLIEPQKQETAVFATLSMTCPSDRSQRSGLLSVRHCLLKMLHGSLLFLQLPNLNFETLPISRSKNKVRQCGQRTRLQRLTMGSLAASSNSMRKADSVEFWILITGIQTFIDIRINYSRICCLQM